MHHLDADKVTGFELLHTQMAAEKKQMAAKKKQLQASKQEISEATLAIIAQKKIPALQRAQATTRKWDIDKRRERERFKFLSDIQRRRKRRSKDYKHANANKQLLLATPH